jgi:hypothetical protein
MLFHEAPRHGGSTAEPEPPPTIRRTFQRLRMVGLSPAEAGNLTAHLSGLRVARQPWTISEIERLMFLRSLVDTGRLTS